MTLTKPTTTSFQVLHRQLGKTNEKFVIFYFLWVGGICTCVWNAMMNSFDYFDKMYPKDEVAFILPIPITVAQLIVTLVITHLSKVVSFSKRVIFPLSFMIIMAFIIPLQAEAFANENHMSFGMVLLILLTLFLGLCNNTCFASVLAFASQIHGKYSAIAHWDRNLWTFIELYEGSSYSYFQWI